MTVGEAASSTRLSVEEGVLARGLTSFAQDVRAGLSATPKYLPARHLYDAVGSALYEAITLLPEYYLTRVETSILQRNADAIFDRVGTAEIVELGPGDGRKSQIVIEAALRRQALLRYRPIDISASSLRALAERLVVEYDRLIVSAYCGDYRSALLRRDAHGEHAMLVMFLGSSIGNYAPHEAVELLRGIASAMHGRDALLLGTDLKKSRATLERAYDDPGGVTAAFNRNLLVRINRELGGAFDLRTFDFVVEYDEQRACVDSFQESLVAQRVPIAALELDAEFAAGERILTESSYKYDAASIADLARASGFTLSACWSDDARAYRLNLLRPQR